MTVLKFTGYEAKHWGQHTRPTLNSWATIILDSFSLFRPRNLFPFVVESVLVSVRNGQQSSKILWARIRETLLKVQPFCLSNPV